MSWRPTPRSLVLVDVENICGAPHLSPELAHEAAAALAEALPPLNTPLVTVGVDAHNAFAAKTAWPNARLVVGRGPDGADLALLGSVAGTSLRNRFEHVVIASGDGVFAPFAYTARLLGLAVSVVAREGSCAKALARAASAVVLLTGRDDEPSVAVASAGARHAA